MAAESPRRVAAREFGTVLRRAMKRHRTSSRRLHVDAGVSRTAIENYLAGNNLPKLQTALKLADLLENDGLAEIIRSSRTYACPVCHRAFTHEGQSRKTYCSGSCRDVAAKMRLGRGVPKRADTAERRLGIHVAAIDAFCRGCEPAGICRTVDCALRPVSPLPLAVSA
jgi:transcriptional regulator with XRE-family HTH domain